MKKILHHLLPAMKILIGCFVFSAGFNLFLEPNGLNAGGLSGLAMVLVRLLKVGTVGVVTAVFNLPLFALGGMKIGKKFFISSLYGMIVLAVAIDMLAVLPTPETEPLIGAIYGGLLCGGGLGMVFATGGSTGGSDIIIRLLKLRYRDVPIGTISIVFDAFIAILTGIVFRDIRVALYSGIAIFITGQVIDAVVYRFDYSKVALIITPEYEKVAKEIGLRLDRGATYLNGEGTYSGIKTKVVLTAVRKQQLAELKQLVVEIDPGAFIIVQEAHQVLGDGFSRYSKDSL